MNKATQIAFVTLVILATSKLTLKLGSCSAGLPAEMPVVYVDPLNAFADIGTTFNISVKIFNLTQNFYMSSSEWEPGEPLPPPGSAYNYSLGSIYGFHINLSWNPSALQYVGHLVSSPVEDYPGGVLYGPILELEDVVNSTAGTYSIAATSWPYPAPPAFFNTPNDTATVFSMTFRVKKNEVHSLRLNGVELWVHPILANRPSVPPIIPHKTVDGLFRPVSTTRIESVEIGAFDGTQLLGPVILGEDATMHTRITNYGTLPNLFNLTLHDGTITLAIWQGQSISWGQTRTFSYALKTERLKAESYSITAEAIIEHNGTVFLDSLTSSFTLIDTPLLEIDVSPSTIHKNDTVSLSAGKSFHRDQNGSILNYSWLIYEPNATVPAYEYNGVNATHMLALNGTWKIVLVAEDNWGITYSSSREATTPYRKEILLKVPSNNEAHSNNSLTQEKIAAIIVAAALITTAIMFTYVARRRRK